MTFPQTLLAGSVVVAISTFAPLLGLAEVSGPPSGFPSESLTFNYSLAIRGGPQNFLSDSQSPLSLPEGSINEQRAFSKALNTQSSSSMPEYLSDEQQRSSSSVVIVEEVPAYIIHKPVVRHQEATPPEVMIPVSPTSDDPHLKTQESIDSPYNIALTPVDLQPLHISQKDRWHAFSRFDWPLIPELDSAFFTKDIPIFSPKTQLQPILITLSKPEPGRVGHVRGVVQRLRPPVVGERHPRVVAKERPGATLDVILVHQIRIRTGDVHLGRRGNAQRQQGTEGHQGASECDSVHEETPSFKPRMTSRISRRRP